MKECVQWNPIYNWKLFTFPAGLEPGTATSAEDVLTVLNYSVRK